MHVVVERSIELEEGAIMFMDLEIHCDVTPGERQTYDDPGCEPEAEMTSVHVTAFGAGNLRVVRTEQNEECFKVLDQAATEFVQSNWSDYEEDAMQEASDTEEAYLADRYED